MINLLFSFGRETVCVFVCVWEGGGVGLVLPQSLAATSLIIIGTIDEGLKKAHFNKTSVTEYDVGKCPNVALNNQRQVLEVHVSKGDLTSMWYHTGLLAEGEIAFWNNHKSIGYGEGAHPSITLTSEGQVIEVHQSKSDDTLWFHQGQLNGKTLLLGQSIQYGDGATPSVAAALIGSSHVQIVEVGIKSSVMQYHSVSKKIPSRQGQLG